MKYMRFLAIFPLLFVLAGCGGGGGGSSALSRQAVVTFNVKWPVASRSATRAIPVNTQFILVEGFVGEKPLGSILLHKDGSKVNASDHLSVPLTAITFFAHAFAADPTNAGQNYSTDPATGHLKNNGVFLDNNAPNAPLASAVNSIVVNDNTTVNLTLDNTIATIVPTNAAITVISAPIGHQVDLNSILLTATDANGATVLYDPSSLTWTTDPTDSLATTRIQIETGKTKPGTNIPDNHLATLLASGPVRLVVSDTDINSALNQVFIKATIGINLVATGTNHVGVDALKLKNFTPLYAKSVTLTLTETPLPGGTDPSAKPISSTPANVTNPVPDVNGGTVTVDPVTLDYTPTGRPYTIKVQAWSEAGGNGVLIAETSAASTTLTQSGNTFTYGGALFSTLADYKISGFKLTVSQPSNPPAKQTSIYYLDPAQQPSPGPPLPLLPNTAQATVTLQVNGNDTNSQIDPGTVTFAFTLNPGIANIDAAGVITANPVGALKTATLTVTDSKNVPFPSVKNSATINVYPASGTAGLNIN